MINENILKEYNTVTLGLCDRKNNPTQIILDDLENTGNKALENLKKVQGLEKEESERIQENNENAIETMVRGILNSGINPNLLNISVSPFYESTKQDFQSLRDLYNNVYKGAENDKDRVTKIIMGLLALVGLAVKSGSK